MASIVGVCLGLLLFACVRLRMHFGPIIRARWGNLMRKVYWLFTIMIMVLLANAGLALVRHFTPVGDTPILLLEIWFITVAVAISFGLIFRRMTRNR
ncbi:MAG: hypothetical protein P8R04_02330 [Gammaproteobacteria bacterium]|nr:hypothetical protein [Gammaproteobacteria bacterium]